MRIIKFESKYLDQMAKLFADVYSEPGKVWSLEKVKEYLQRDLDDAPQYCLAAVDDNDNCLGAVFCKVDPYYDYYSLLVDSLQIEEEYRKQGIAKSLLKEVVELAKKDGIKGVHLLADAREGYPRSWYERLGFKLSGWAEYGAEMEDIEI